MMAASPLPVHKKTFTGTQPIYLFHGCFHIATVEPNFVIEIIWPPKPEVFVLVSGHLKKVIACGHLHSPAQVFLTLWRSLWTCVFSGVSLGLRKGPLSSSSHQLFVPFSNLGASWDVTASWS